MAPVKKICALENFILGEKFSVNTIESSGYKPASVISSFAATFGGNP